jgi:hypothetical protein
MLPIHTTGKTARGRFNNNTKISIYKFINKLPTHVNNHIEDTNERKNNDYNAIIS